MRVYGFVPAKGTSERIENKNMRFLDGERLYIRALKTLLKCKEIDTVYLDTESQEMFDLINYLPIKFMKRDPQLATNNTDGHQMLLNEVNNNPDADIYVQLLCTSPFISPETIDNAIRLLKNSNDYDSAILMKKDKYYFWKDGEPQYNINHIPNSKDLPDTINESMGLYIIKKETALKNQKRFGTSPLFIWGNNLELVDVNTPEELSFAETIAKGLKSTETQQFNLIRHFVTSSALSDLLDDLKVEKNTECGAVINGFKSNTKNTKLLGRANTLKLRKLEKDEDFKGIYKALDSYEGITDNDIIVVENDLPDYAYFGDLNARLAIKSGAIGAIINGATRDQEQTQTLGFPVFCKGYNATDVRHRATVDYINKPVCINNIKITPGDLIFIDNTSMVVIYQKYEKEVIKRVLEIFKTEKFIVDDIIDGKSIKEIIELRGAF